MTTESSYLLKLRAEDLQDLKVLSACLQDAILPTSAMSYHPEDQVFALLVNRFMWEQEPEQHNGQDMYKRVHTGLYFSYVTDMKKKNIDQMNPNDFLSLLTINGETEGEIHLIFAGDRQVTLFVDKIMCHLKDLHEPWHTHQKPAHAA